MRSTPHMFDDAELSGQSEKPVVVTSPNPSCRRGISYTLCIQSPPVGGGLVTLFVFNPPPTGGVRGGHKLQMIFGIDLLYCFLRYSRGYSRHEVKIGGRVRRLGPVRKAPLTCESQRRL